MLALWYGVDAMAEKYPNMGGYVYCHSNPIMLVDPDGNDDYYDMEGQLLIRTNTDTSLRFVVTSSKESRSIRRMVKKGMDIDVSTIHSSVELPDNTVLQTALDVLDKTNENGGEYEECALVSRTPNEEQHVMFGKRGDKMEQGKTVATSSLPTYQDGWNHTENNNTVSIHSHPTSTKNNLVSFADQMGPNDAGVFSQYPLNIIVGNNSNGQKNMINLYNNNDKQPYLSISSCAIREIIKK